MASTVFDDALDLLIGRFTNDPRNREGGYLTPYAAVKKAFGVDRDDPAVAYNGSSWPALAAEMSRAFDALDEVTAEPREHPTPFIVWGSRPERTETEVRAVLAEAAARHPTMAVADLARLRPSVPKMPGTRKTRWVICNQLALIAAGRRSSFAAVVSSIPLVHNESSFEVIEKLDRIVDDEGIPWQRLHGFQVAVLMSKAWGTMTKNDPTYSFFRFIEEALEPRSVWLKRDDVELGGVFERFAEVHSDDEAPEFRTPFLA
jgi:hypothetical protein